jgi:hypothetical protein
MKEREPDDTPKPAPPPPQDEGAREPGAYYYDDATGYEIYSPGEDDGEEGSAQTQGRGAGLKRNTLPAVPRILIDKRASDLIMAP